VGVHWVQERGGVELRRSLVVTARWLEVVRLPMLKHHLRGSVGSRLVRDLALPSTLVGTLHIIELTSHLGLAFLEDSDGLFWVVQGVERPWVLLPVRLLALESLHFRLQLVIESEPFAYERSRGRLVFRSVRPLIIGELRFHGANCIFKLLLFGGGGRADFASDLRHASGELRVTLVVQVGSGSLLRVDSRRAGRNPCGFLIRLAESRAVLGVVSL